MKFNSHAWFRPMFGLLLCALLCSGTVGCAVRSPDESSGTVAGTPGTIPAADTGKAEAISIPPMGEVPSSESETIRETTGSPAAVMADMGDSGSEPPREDAGPVISSPAIPRRSSLNLGPFLKETSAPGKSTLRGDKEKIVLNFDAADLGEVIRTFAELLDINYMMDSAVQGAVTIQTAGELNRDELFTVFFQILEANGLTAIRDGGLYRIVPVKESSRMTIATGVGGRKPALSAEQRMVMQIIPLAHISTEEMTQILTPFISSSGTILSHPDSNTLLLVDNGPGVAKALRLVEAFDVDIFDQVAYRFFPARYLSAEDLSNLLTEVMTAFGKEDRTRLKLIPIDRLDKILALSPDPGVFRRLETFLAQLDVPGDSIEPRIFIYPVRNGSADELANLLASVFSPGETEAKSDSDAGSVESSPERAPTGRLDPFARTSGRTREEAPNGRGAPETIVGTSTSLRGPLNITPDPARNTLIIEALPADYRIVEDILERIDILPRQVLIEVLIAEVSLDGKEELGVEWKYRKGPGNLSTSLLSAEMGGSGLQFAIGEESGRWNVALSTLASESKLNVLSRPVVLASDSTEAKINVSTQIPVASAQYLFDSGSQGVTQTNIQYRDTGIILGVTPYISQNGMVRMEISQEVSESGDGVDVGGQNFPSFRERRVSTTLTVRDSQTIFMGGLMRERKTRGNSGIPYLSRIPFIGFLFGRDTSSNEKSELILLITPRVIHSLADADAVSGEFKSKLERIESNLKTAPGVFPSVR